MLTRGPHNKNHCPLLFHITVKNMCERLYQKIYAVLCEANVHLHIDSNAFTYTQ